MIRKSKIYGYLLEHGHLSKSKDELKLIKAAFWKAERIAWKKLKREHSKVYEVLLDEQQNKAIAKSAKEHGYSKVGYIKSAALAYTNRQYLVPRIDILYEVKTLLAANCEMLQEMVIEHHLPASFENKVLTQMNELESKVVNLLFNPPKNAG